MSDDEAIESMKARAKKEKVRQKPTKMTVPSQEPSPKPVPPLKRIKTPRLLPFVPTKKETVNLLEESIDMRTVESLANLKRPTCSHKIIVNHKSSNSQQLPYRFTMI
jgi:hypothetical protein